MWPLKKDQKGFQIINRLMQVKRITNAPRSFKSFVFSIFEWTLKEGFTVSVYQLCYPIAWADPEGAGGPDPP